MTSLALRLNSGGELTIYGIMYLLVDRLAQNCN
jgi:hypothetical protein